MNFSGLLESSYLSIGLDLNLSGQETYLSVGARARNPPPPQWCGSSYWRVPWRGRRPCPKTPSVIDDIAEVITTTFSLPAVLSYPSMHVIVGQTPIAAGRGCCFISSSFCSIIRSVTTRGFTSMVSGRWCRCDDVACRLNPLLGQSDEWRVRWDHPLD
jgi:hypothetical protein